MIRKLKESLNDELPSILTGLVQNSLNFLFKDFESYPEHRLGLFNLVEAMVDHSLNCIFNLGMEGFTFVLNTLLWGTKHHQTNIGEKALGIMVKLIDILSTEPNIFSSFGKS